MMKTKISTNPSNAPPEIKSLYALLIERAPLPMVEVEGPHHLVCFVNSAFCSLIQKEKQELLGKPFTDLVCNGPACAELLDRVYELGESEVHATPDDSAPAYWLYAMWPSLDLEEEPRRTIIQVTKTVDFRQNAVALNEALLIGSLRQHELRQAAEASNASLQLEISERHRVEEQLKAAKTKLEEHAEELQQTVAERTAELRTSLAELEAFAYSLAHDLRAPVRAIHGFTQIALERLSDDSGLPAAGLLHRVVKAAIRMDSLIQDVLNLSHAIQRPITLSAVDLNSLVRSLINERPDLARPRAEISVVSPLLPMLAHEAMLSQCLTNLLSNAVKFVRTGVIPQIRLWTEELRDADSRAVVRLWVEDQGIGIDASEQPRIFEIFLRLQSSARYTGSGIGLAIVRKAVDRMGGNTGVESDGDGKGCRFWLELPAP